MNLSIVLSTHQASFQAVAFKGDLEENIKRVTGWGYRGVELAIRDPRLVNANQLLELVAKYNAVIPAIGTGQAWGEEHLSYTDPDPAVRRAAIERTKSHIPFAARADALIIIGLLRGLVRPEIEHAQAMEWMISALQECCDAAADEGVRIALEPLNRYETTLINTTAQGLDMLATIARPNMGLLLDTFHMNIEDPDIIAAIVQAGDRVFHFHIADSNRWYPGAGHLDFGHILRSLDDSGYKGWVSGEFMPIPDANTSALRCIEHLRMLQLVD